jgi:hypothetical protein
MKSQESEGRRGSEQLRAVRFDLAFRAVLVAGLWSILRMLGGDLTAFVSVTILAAVFGPDTLRAGREWLSEGNRNKSR